MITPMHTATIGGRPLRFFQTPNDDGLPDLPWHAVDDLHRCLGLNRAARQFFMHKLRTDWGTLRTVATADGVVTIAPHFMVQGTIDAMVENKMAPASVRREYDRAGTVACEKLVPPGLVFPSDTWLAWMKAAMNRWEKPEPQPAA